MNELTQIAKLAGVSEDQVLHAARGVADLLVQQAGGREEAADLMRGADNGEVAVAMFADYSERQRRAAIQATTNSEQFQQLVAYKLVDKMGLLSTDFEV